MVAWGDFHDGSLHERNFGSPVRMVNFLSVEIVPGVEVSECFH